MAQVFRKSRVIVFFLDTLSLLPVFLSVFFGGLSSGSFYFIQRIIKVYNTLILLISTVVKTLIYDGEWARIEGLRFNVEMVMSGTHQCWM